MRIEDSHGSLLRHGSLLARRNDDIVRIPIRTLISVGALTIGLFLGCEPSAPVAKPSAPDTPAIQKESPSSSTEKPSAEPGAEQVVNVQIWRGIGTEQLESTAAWSSGMTVFDALSALSPRVAVESTGQGESLFVKSIAGQANLGSAGDNWIFRVNGKLGDRSCGIYELEAGDSVVWSFGKYE